MAAQTYFTSFDKRFFTPRATSRDDPALFSVFAAECADDRDFATFEDAEDLVSDFAMTIRSTDQGRAVENPCCINEIDLVRSKIDFSFVLIPTEHGNAREQSFVVIRHSAPPRITMPIVIQNGDHRMLSAASSVMVSSRK